MTDSFQDERLSAYLDGELSADEREQVEQWLVENPETQQLVDELRALSRSLQRMPPYQLEEGFRDKVLRSAERAMLTSSSQRSGVEASVEPNRVRPPSRRSLRPLAWSGAAIAVALLLMFIIPERQFQRRQVAQGLRDTGASTPLSNSEKEELVVSSAPSVVGSLNERTVDKRENELGITPAESGAERTPGFKGDGRLELHASPKRRASGSGRQASELEAAADLKKGTEEFRRLQDLGYVGKDAEGSVGGQNRGVDFDVDLDSPSRGAVELGEAKQSLGVRSGDVGGGAGIGGAQASDTSPIRIVQVEISPQAAENHAFSKLLTKQQIVWEDGYGDTSKPMTEEADAAPSKNGARTSSQDSPAEEANDDFEPHAEWDAVYVVATANQVTQALADINADSKQFTVVREISAEVGDRNLSITEDVPTPESDWAQSRPLRRRTPSPSEQDAADELSNRPPTLNSEILATLSRQLETQEMQEKGRKTESPTSWARRLKIAPSIGRYFYERERRQRDKSGAVESSVVDGQKSSSTKVPDSTEENYKDALQIPTSTIDGLASEEAAYRRGDAELQRSRVLFLLRVVEREIRPAAEAQRTDGQ